ncbi:MAG: hypothetical protein GAK34_02604 [Delftia tsuruhatensis]|nr:MAG: hypothetical protein GAK34_02604 [Delftia tsuruhatensis]
MERERASTVSWKGMGKRWLQSAKLRVRSLVLMQRSQTCCWQARSAAASSSRSFMPPAWCRLVA